MLNPRPPLQCTPFRSTGASSTGLTAIELLMVIVIIAILASLALPSFKGTIARYRIRQASENMSATIYFARSEAIKRGGQVTLRKSATGSGCSASTAQEWSCGWTVFMDENEDGNLDATDIELRAAIVPRRVEVKTTAASGPAFLTFDRWGRASATLYGFEFKSLDDPSATARLLCVSLAGRVQTFTTLATCPTS